MGEGMSRSDLLSEAQKAVALADAMRVCGLKVEVVSSGGRPAGFDPDRLREGAELVSPRKPKKKKRRGFERRDKWGDVER